MSDLQLKQKEITPEEKEVMLSVASPLAKELNLIPKEHNGGEQALCYRYGNELAMKLEIRKTQQHLQIAIYDPEIREQTFAFLKREKIRFADHGDFLHIITPWQSGRFKGLKVPDIKVATQNFGAVKMIATGTNGDHTRGEPLVDIAVLLGFHQIATVTVAPEAKWVDSVDIDYQQMPLTMALCNASDFPFRDFILAELNANNFAYGSRKEKKSAETLVKEAIKDRLLKELERDKSAWSTTNPRKHNPKNFRYIVHSLSEEIWATEFESKEAEKKYFGGYDGNPLKQPRLFVKLPYISCSLIDRDHPTAWSGVGLILNVPQANIRKAHPGDMHSFIKSDGEDDYDSALPSASELLEVSSRQHWNEVVVAGVNKRAGSKISIVGGFVARERGRMEEPPAPGLASKLRKFCMARNLPVVTIDVPKDRMHPVPGWAAD